MLDKEQGLRAEGWALGHSVPCLTRGSRALVGTAGAGLATGFLLCASPTAPASAVLALEADTAARIAAAPGALCFLFLPPIFQLLESSLPDPDPGCRTAEAGELSRLPAPTPPPSLLHPGSTAGAQAQLVRFIRLRLLAPGIRRHVCRRAPLVAKFLVIELPNSQWSKKKRSKTQTRRRKVTQALRLAHF